MQPWKYLLISFGSLFIEGPNQNVSFDNGCKQPDCLTICIMVTERLQVLLLREIKLQCCPPKQNRRIKKNQDLSDRLCVLNLAELPY